MNKTTDNEGNYGPLLEEDDQFKRVESKKNVLGSRRSIILVALGIVVCILAGSYLIINGPNDRLHQIDSNTDLYADVKDLIPLVANKKEIIIDNKDAKSIFVKTPGFKETVAPEDHTQALWVPKKKNDMIVIKDKDSWLGNKLVTRD